MGWLATTSEGRWWQGTVAWEKQRWTELGPLPPPGNIASSSSGEVGGESLGLGVGQELGRKSQPPLSCISRLVVRSPHGSQTREAACSSTPASDLSWSSGISA